MYPQFLECYPSSPPGGNCYCSIPWEHLQSLPTAHEIILGAMVEVSMGATDARNGSQSPEVNLGNNLFTLKNKHASPSSKNFPITYIILRQKMNLLILMDYIYTFLLPFIKAICLQQLQLTFNPLPNEASLDPARMK